MKLFLTLFLLYSFETYGQTPNYSKLSEVIHELRTPDGGRRKIIDDFSLAITSEMKRVQHYTHQNINILSGLDDSEIITFYNKFILYTDDRLDSKVENRIQNFSAWLAFSIKIVLEESNHYTLTDYMKHIARWGESEWTLVQYFITPLKETNSTDKMSKLFTHFKTITENVLRLHRYDIGNHFKPLSVLLKRDDFSDFLLIYWKAEIRRLLERTEKASPEEIESFWNTEYIDFIADFKHPTKVWSLKELHSLNLYPRDLLSLTTIYKDQHKDANKLARVIFTPKIGRTRHLQGKLTGFFGTKTTLISADKTEHTLSKEAEGQFHYVFVFEPEHAPISYDDYLAEFQKLYPVLKSGDRCAGLLVD